MSSNENKALKAGAWYTISNFLMRSIGIITTPIFARLLTEEEFGSYNNFTTWLGILTICVTLNLESTFISARYDFEDDFDGYIFSVLSLSSITSGLSILLLNLIFPIIQPVLSLDRFYLNCILVYLVLFPAVNMFQTRERYLYKYKVSVFLSFFISIGTTVLSILLMYFMSDALTGRVLGSLIPTIAVGMVLYPIIVRMGKKINTSYWKYAIKICLPFIPHLLSMTLLNSMDKTMIIKICGEKENGLYSLAYTCGSLISILIVSMNTAYAPWLGKKLKDKEYGDIRAFAKKYIFIFAACAILLMLLAPEALWLVGGSRYLAALYVMPPVACGCVFQFLYTMFVSVEQFNKKTVGMAIASVSAAILNYVLNAIFIPEYGYIAAAYTTLVGFVWLLIAHMFLVKLYKMGQVYPYKLVILVASCALLITLGVNYMYGAPVIRYCFSAVYISVLICVIIKNKDQVLKFVKRRSK